MWHEHAINIIREKLNKELKSREREWETQELIIVIVCDLFMFWFCKKKYSFHSNPHAMWLVAILFQFHPAHAHQIWKIISVLKENHLSFPYHAYYHRHVKLFISHKLDQSTSRFCSRRLRNLHSCDRRKKFLTKNCRNWKKNIFLYVTKIFGPLTRRLFLSHIAARNSSH